MLNEVLSSAKEYAKNNKRSIVLLLLLVFGIGMLLFASSEGSDTGAESDGEDALTVYKERLESELSDICSSVAGVGRCRVTVTFERGEERVYKGSSLIESRPPRVMGVTVICKGADSDAVRREIVGMMSALFDIGTNRIAVLKLNS